MRYISFMLISLLFLSTTLLAQEEENVFYTKIGEKVPSFSFTAINGKTYKIEDFKGKVVLVNFFATWCGPCMTEMPELQSGIWDKYKKEDFVLIAIGREHNIDELKEFNSKKNFSFIIGADPAREIYGKFAPQTIPRNYIIDKKGNIVFQEVGYSKEEFQKMVLKIKDLLKK